MRTIESMNLMRCRLLREKMNRFFLLSTENTIPQLQLPGGSVQVWSQKRAIMCPYSIIRAHSTQFNVSCNLLHS